MDWKALKMKIVMWFLGQKQIVENIETQLETCVSYVVQRAVSEGKISAEVGEIIMNYVDDKEIVKDFLDWLKYEDEKADE